MKTRQYKSIVVFLLTIISCLHCQAYAAPIQKPVPLTSIPIEIINNRVMIDIRMGHRVLAMALDTGASSTALFQSKSHDFSDLAIEEEASIIFPALDEVVSGARLKPIPLTLGAEHIYFPKRLIRIDRRPPIGDRLNFKFDGVLGQDFFAHYVVEINRETGFLYLYEAGTDLRKHFLKTLQLYIQDNAPYIILHNRMPWEKDQVPKKLMLDTGYPGAMVLWNNQHFKQAARGENLDLLRAENRGIFTNINFSIGRLRFLRTPIFVSPNEPVQAHSRDGIIGSNVLIWYHHVIDFPGNRILLNTGSVNFNLMDPAYYVPDREDFIVKKFAPTMQQTIVTKYSIQNK